MSYSATELSLLIGGLAVLTIYSAIRLRAALIHGGCGFQALLRAWRKRLAEGFSGLVQRKEGDSVIDECIIRHVNTHREKNVCSFVRSIANIYTLVLLTVLMNVYMQSPRWMQLHQTWVLVVQCLLSAILPLCPRISCCLDAWYAFLMISASVYIAFPTNEVLMFVSVSTQTFLRFIGACCYARLPPVLIWNAVYVAVSIFSYRTLDLTDASVTLRMFALFEVIMAVLACMVADAMEKHLWAEARMKIQSSVLQGESSATRTMLRLVCDVSLELDEDLKIKEDSPEFAALFMMNPEVSVAGMTLQHLMPSEEDKVLYEERMTSASESDKAALAGLLQVKMRDSLGSQIGMELFYVQYQMLDHKHYLVGLRESADQPIAELKTFKKSRRQALALEGKQQEGSSSAPAAASAGGCPAGRGTQAALPKESLIPDDTSDCDSESSDGSVTSSFSDASQKHDDSCKKPDDGSERSGHDQRHHESSALMPTTSKARRVSLFNVIRTWCFESHGHWCCPFHAATTELRRTVTSMVKHECYPTFTPVTGVQCTRCGTLAEVDLREGGSSARPGRRCAVCRSQRFRSSVILGL